MKIKVILEYNYYDIMICGERLYSRLDIICFKFCTFIKCKIHKWIINSKCRFFIRASKEEEGDHTRHTKRRLQKKFRFLVTYTFMYFTFPKYFHVFLGDV